MTAKNQRKESEEETQNSYYFYKESLQTVNCNVVNKYVGKMYSQQQVGHYCKMKERKKALKCKYFLPNTKLTI